VDRLDHLVYAGAFSAATIQIIPLVSRPQYSSSCRRTRWRSSSATSPNHRREGHEVMRPEIMLAHDLSNRLLAQVPFDVRVHRQLHFALS